MICLIQWLEVALGPFLVWAYSDGYGESAWLRSLTWTLLFAYDLRYISLGAAHITANGKLLLIYLRTQNVLILFHIFLVFKQTGQPSQEIKFYISTARSLGGYTGNLKMNAEYSSQI